MAMAGDIQITAGKDRRRYFRCGPGKMFISVTVTFSDVPPRRLA